MPPIVDGGLILTPTQPALVLEPIDWRRTVAPALPARPAAVGAGDLSGRQADSLLVEEVMPSATDFLPSDSVVHAATGSAIAKEALERIAALFQIEAEINGHDPKRRLDVRQEHALPRLWDLKDFLDPALASLSCKSTLALAVRCRSSPPIRSCRARPSRSEHRISRPMP